jgi:hypothetical protein
MTNLTIIKNWFTTGKKPTQAQFWATWDSFWHKDDMISILKIDGIQNVYDAINSHVNSPTAHAQILNQSRIYAFGIFQIFKASGNVANILETGDVGVGFLANGTFIPFGKWTNDLGNNDLQDINNWDTSPMWMPEPS